MKDNSAILKMLALASPGTDLRKGLDNILDAETGALIVVSGSSEILSISDGGFEINCNYEPEKIYELAKMDGAIIIDKEVKKILMANVHLQPNSKITTIESGTRHRTAERVAKQTGELVVSISERRKRITLYQNDERYMIRNITDIMSEANQGIKTLERYKTVLDKELKYLTIMEFDEMVTLYEVTHVIQRFEMLFKIADEIKKYIVELGVEGRLINMQLDELLMGTQEEFESLLKDYYNEESQLSMEDIIAGLNRLNQEEILIIENISYLLGYSKNYKTLDDKIVPKGYRVLGKILKLTKRDILKIVETFIDLTSILNATIDDISEIKGISKFKAKSIQNGLKRLKATILLEKEI
ncbi:DNA integrity scanning diadenylate cyclase DisA [Haliovirga abyssi]|uniref:DNA integrity scanning protein DisA n=1 Tax=Haliovirga abyssi TaxID=2996794 RepID=A0AAU9D9X1_9FUSO|nr:DNA integrity scanning diadenylate cyclase DisA [Haliovirga abyssi]BDU50391.1 DNA integrity scanning protein DisA [Haliovirga abyssi]